KELDSVEDGWGRGKSEKERRIPAYDRRAIKNAPTGITGCFAFPSYLSKRVSSMIRLCYVSAVACVVSAIV
ncbi:MAG: hypothetical protein ACI4TW_07820, partial [Prevotella sp.]